MVAIGVDALPMLVTLSMTTGFIFAMQSGAELRRYGALQLVVYIIGIGFTREQHLPSAVSDGKPQLARVACQKPQRGDLIIVLSAWDEPKPGGATAEYTGCTDEIYRCDRSNP